MSYTESPFRSINFLKEEQIPASPTSDELWAVEVASSGNSLFDFKWSDHELNDQSWLRSDTFSWQDGTVYTSAYEHLTEDIDGKTLQSETIGSTTIQFYLSDDGHKICPANQETNVNTIFTATGVAWYYIIDTANTQFKLPRSTYNKYSKELPVKGNGIALGLNDGTNNLGLVGKQQSINLLSGNTDALNKTIGTSAGSVTANQINKAIGIITDPTKSGIIASCISDSNMYLYFYVGQFSKSATEQSAGITTEQLNAKVDKADLIECHAVIETYQNGTSWYRLYNDGWVEQGGRTAASTSTTITLLKQMLDTNYNVNITVINSNGDQNWAATNLLTTGFTLVDSESKEHCWNVKGYSA